MKRYLMALIFAGTLLALATPQAFAQFGSVKGTCRDMEGKPIAGATVQFQGLDTGRKYELKTNAKGEYFSLGIAPEKYRITLVKDGQELDKINGAPITMGENVYDFDLKKSQQEAAQQKGISPEQLKQMQEQQEKAAKETNVVKALNEKLLAANTASQGGDYDTAINVLTEATQLDATRDLIWFKLGDAYRLSATKQTDAAERSKRMGSAVTDYEKAVDIKKKAIDAATQKKPEDQKQLAAYYNNLGEAYARNANLDGAKNAYMQAAQLDPPGSGQYYFNLGAVLTNANGSNDPEMRKAAVDAFDKAIAADPNRADAYYWKGSNLIGMATLKEDKMIAPEGTAEAFQKYIELQPTGPHAEEAKAMLAGIGATVQTSYGQSKKKTTKKP
jgi:tetratricopeptide (TPR) repeat protein